MRRLAISRCGANFRRRGQRFECLAESRFSTNELALTCLTHQFLSQADARQHGFRARVERTPGFHPRHVMIGQRPRRPQPCHRDAKDHRDKLFDVRIPPFATGPAHTRKRADLCGCWVTFASTSRFSPSEARASAHGPEHPSSPPDLPSQTGATILRGMLRLTANCCPTSFPFSPRER